MSIVEGVSYLLLLATTIAYRSFDGPDFTAQLGPAHGFLFVAYVLMVFPVAMRLQWSALLIVLALVASVVPFATFYVERKWLDEPAPRGAAV